LETFITGLLTMYVYFTLPTSICALLALMRKSNKQILTLQLYLDYLSVFVALSYWYQMVRDVDNTLGDLPSELIMKPLWKALLHGKPTIQKTPRTDISACCARRNAHLQMLMSSRIRATSLGPTVGHYLAHSVQGYLGIAFNLLIAIDERATSELKEGYGNLSIQMTKQAHNDQLSYRTLS
jgi:hypothetical protein